MRKKVYRPRALLEKQAFQRALAKRLTEKGLEWGVPQAEIDSMVGYCTVYEEKALAASIPAERSPGITAARDAAWAKLWEEASICYMRYLLVNDAISQEDQEALGISERESSSGVPIPAQAMAPVVKLDGLNVASFTVRFRQEEDPSIHKPYGVGYCQMVAKVGGEAPATVSDCHLQYNMVSQGYQISFEMNQRGQMVYCFARWVNRNGKEGPWSGMFSAIIP